MIRDGCGTVRGITAHQAHGEPWCGFCAAAVRLAELDAERLRPVPVPPPAPVPVSPAEGYRYRPVTAREASVNRRLLEAALDGLPDEDMQDAPA